MFAGCSGAACRVSEIAGVTSTGGLGPQMQMGLPTVGDTTKRRGGWA